MIDQDFLEGLHDTLIAVAQDWIGLMPAQWGLFLIFVLIDHSEGSLYIIELYTSLFEIIN
jgi:hypothetical protein